MEPPAHPSSTSESLSDDHDRQCNKLLEDTPVSHLDAINLGCDLQEEAEPGRNSDVEKVRLKHCVFPIICGSGGSKSRLATAAGAEPAGHMKDEKLHAVVARSTFGSKKWPKLMASEHVWKLRCRKSARCSGAKAHLEVNMVILPHVRATYGCPEVIQTSKKCTPLWREAHVQVKSAKI